MVVSCFCFVPSDLASRLCEKICSLRRLSPQSRKGRRKAQRKLLELRPLLLSVPAAPSPKESARPVDPIRAEIKITFELFIPVFEKYVRSIQMTATRLVIFVDSPELALRVMCYGANAVAVSAETPFSFNPRQCP